MQGLLPLVVMFGLMWALLIRPQQRRARMHRALVDSLRPGDEIITSGGLCGSILSVDEEVLLLEVADGVSVRVLRGAVQQVISPDEPSDTPELDGPDDEAGAEPGSTGRSTPEAVAENGTAHDHPSDGGDK